MREKAPGSGGPAAGNPKGVKSGHKLFAEIKEQVQKGGEADPATQIAPAEQDIRETKADGSADPDNVTHVESREEADAKVAEDIEKIDDMADDPASQPEQPEGARLADDGDDAAARRRKAAANAKSADKAADKRKR